MGKEINTWCELDSTVAEFARIRNRLCEARTLVSSATCGILKPNVKQIVILSGSEESRKQDSSQSLRVTQIDNFYEN